MMKNLNSFRIKAMLFAVLSFSTLHSLKAQQEVMYSQYMFNTLALNPAYAGSRDVLSLTALGRYQWVDKNVPGAPTTHSITLDMPFKNEKMGVGLVAYNDRIGLASTTGISIPYAYRFKLTAKTTMSLGIQANVTNASINLSKIYNDLVDPNDAAFQNDQSRLLINTGLGLFISNDKSYLSFSVPQLLEQKISNDTSKVSIKVRRHYFATMGFVIGKGNFKIKPSMMLRYTPGGVGGVDGNINFWYKDKISLGVSGRKSQVSFTGQENFDALVAMMELQLTPQIRVGYAYDYNNNRLGTSSGKNGFYNKLTSTPTHEVLIRYEFGYGKSKILTPRYF
jgi:type IX secretion system PorP/SprF family membrane protein